MASRKIITPELPEVIITPEVAINEGLLDDCIKNRSKGLYILSCYSYLLKKKILKGESYMFNSASVFIVRDKSTIEPKLSIALEFADTFKFRKVKTSQPKFITEALKHVPDSHKYKFPIR